jgi:hypothetical protein
MTHLFVVILRDKRRGALSEPLLAGHVAHLRRHAHSGAMDG